MKDENYLLLLREFVSTKIELIIVQAGMKLKMVKPSTVVTESNLKVLCFVIKTNY